MFNNFWQCNKYATKQLKNIDFITCWSSQNVSKLFEENFRKSPFYGVFLFFISVMFNYGCVILDVCPVRIGEHTMIGPN